MKRLFGLLVVLASLAPVAALAQPDLTATGVTTPPRLFTGKVATFSFDIQNIGDQPANGFVYKLYLSDNRVITLNDMEIYTSTTMNLAAGATQSVSVDVTIPATVATGSYYVGLIVDPGEVVGDSNLFNNVKRSAGPVDVLAPAPDLTASEVRVPANAAAGETIPVTFTLENRGNLAASFDYGVYLSTNTIISTDDVLLFERTRHLEAAEQQTITDYVRLAPGLPAGDYYVGLVLDPNNAVAELDETNNARGSADPVAVAKPALALLTTFVPEATVSVPYDWRFAAIGGTGGYAYALTSGTLPDGLTLDGTTGEISGTPTVTGESSFVLQVTSGNLTASTAFTLLVTRPSVSLSVETEALPPAILQTAYSTKLAAVGGLPPYEWSTKGQLPDGVTLDPTGTLSGTPQVVGAWDLVLAVQDARGSVATQVLSMRVVDQGMLTISTPLLPVGQTDEAYIAGFDVLGGTQPITWSIVDGELPPGLALDSQSGIISGSPAAVGRFHFEVHALDADGLFDTNGYTILIIGQPVSIVTTEIADATVGKDYTQSFHVLPSSGRAPYTWSISSGELPAGLSLDGGTGVISGTPAKGTGGTYTFVLSVEDSRAATGMRAYAFDVTDPALAQKIAVQPKASGGCTSAPGAGGLGLAFAVLALLAAGLRRRRAVVVPVLVVALLAPAAARASWTYSVVEKPATFQAISGGTIVSGVSGADEAYSTVQIPFTFTYYGQPFTSVGISSNGFVMMGTISSSSLGNQSLPDPSTPNAVIAPWWDDLTNGQVSTLVEGTPPNRDLVVEFLGSQRYAGTTTFNFQVRLYEGSNVIKVSYGTASAASDSSSATAGIESPDGTLATIGLACTPTCSAADWPTNTSFSYSTAPDLVTPTADAPTIVYGAIPAQITATISNLGGKDAGRFDVNAVLSTDDVYDAGDQLLTGTVSIPGLASGASVDTSLVATLPASVTPNQDYWIFVVPDLAHRVPEANTANNASPPVKVHTGPPTPNFRVSIPVISGSSFAPGDSFSLTDTIANTGNLQATTDYVVVLSDNAVISTEDLVLSQGSVTLSARGSQTITDQVTLPADVATGTYYVGVIADPTNAVDEPDEVDNAAATVNPIAVTTGTVSVLTPNLPAGKVGRPYETWLEGGGGDGTFTWSVVSGSLPPGIALSTAGELSGTPTAAGDYSVQIIARSAGKTGLGNLSISVAANDAPLTVATATLPEAVFGGEYGTQLLAVGGTPPYTWKVTAGSLPPGMAVTDGGLLGGIARDDGDFAFTVTVTDADGTTSDAPVTLHVAQPGNLLVVTMDMPQATLGKAYQATLVAAGGAPPYKWSIAGSSHLPAGLDLSPDGVVSGTPTEVGVFDVVVQVGDSRSQFDTNTLSLTVGYDQGISITTEHLPVATYGMSYKAKLTAVGGSAPYSWSIVGGSMPDGLDLADDGTISGMPVGNGAQLVAFIVQAEDGAGRMDIRGLSIRVGDPPAVEAKQGCSTAGGNAPMAILLVVLGLGLVLRKRS